MMKRVILVIAAIFALGLAGCDASVTPPKPPIFFTGSWMDNDPVGRASDLGASEKITELENGQTFDIGIGINRGQYFDGSNANDSQYPLGAIAFEKNGSPVQASSAILNGIILPWYAPKPDTIYWCNLYGSSDSALSADNVTFSYQNFDGDSFSGTLPVAEKFGYITCPDTISSSQGYKISYLHFIPSDSIYVTISAGDTLISWSQPDTGIITILPNQLPSVPDVWDNYYTITFYRIRWQTLVSPGGKKIGIYSSENTECGIYVKP